MNYPKINTIFKRDMDYNGKKKPLLLGDYSQPEIEYLKDLKWECTEKIDGTNIHVDLHNIVSPDGDKNQISMDFCGRTDKSVIPKHLKAKLEQLFDTNALAEVFIKNPLEKLHVSIFGEGYGMKIQNGGNYISNDVDFILFDVNVNGIWLSRTSCEEIAKSLNVGIVPLIGYFTVDEAIDIVKKGFKSTISENKDYNAEGLVLKTPYYLSDSMGNRIITKIKTCDFNNK